MATATSEKPNNQSTTMSPINSPITPPITIKFTAVANEDLQRLADFLYEVAPHKVAEAMGLILDSIDSLATMPMLGMAVPCNTFLNLRKLSVHYGKSGYVVLYSFIETDNIVVIETIYHMRELKPKFLQNSQ